MLAQLISNLNDYLLSHPTKAYFLTTSVVSGTTMSPTRIMIYKDTVLDSLDLGLSFLDSAGNLLMYNASAVYNNVAACTYIIRTLKTDGTVVLNDRSDVVPSTSGGIYQIGAMVYTAY